MIKQELVRQSVKIFDKLEKWNALFEIHSQSDAIMNAWLDIGAEALRKDFKARPSPSWTCAQWEGRYETKWYLSELGCDSIFLGYGWPSFEFHLIFQDPANFAEAASKRVLQEPAFEPLVDAFDREEASAKRGNYHSLACDATFNPFGSDTDALERRRELTWYAAHETDYFVIEMSRHVRRITDDPAMTALVRELNRRAKSVPK
jgi:hypothetical protein